MSNINQFHFCTDLIVESAKDPIVKGRIFAPSFFAFSFLSFLIQINIYRLVQKLLSVLAKSENRRLYLFRLGMDPIGKRLPRPIPVVGNNHRKAKKVLD